MLVNKPAQGFGMRSWRYAAVINDGTVEKCCGKSQVEKIIVNLTHMVKQVQNKY